jgi:hypothetical protein
VEDLSQEEMGVSAADWTNFNVQQGSRLETTLN